MQIIQELLGVFGAKSRVSSCLQRDEQELINPSTASVLLRPSLKMIIDFMRGQML